MTWISGARRHWLDVRVVMARDELSCRSTERKKKKEKKRESICYLISWLHFILKISELNIFLDMTTTLQNSVYSLIRVAGPPPCRDWEDHSITAKLEEVA